MGKPTQRPMCVYCDQREGTTNDHVVPKSVFLPPLPGNMVVVPACEPCNGEKSKDDDYLRDMLLLDWENETHPMAQGELKKKLIRSIGHNRSHLIREGRRTRRPTPFHSIGGVYLCTAPAIPLDQARINRIFGRIVRGLYYRFTEETRLPADCSFEVGKIHPMAKEQTARIFDRPEARMYTMGDSFHCVYVIPKKNPTVSLWLLQLLNVLVMVATNAEFQAV
jgi:hypothetical protein